MFCDKFWYQQISEALFFLWHYFTYLWIFLSTLNLTSPVMLNGVVGFQVKIMTLDPDMNLTVYYLRPVTVFRKSLRQVKWGISSWISWKYFGVKIFSEYFPKQVSQQLCTTFCVQEICTFCLYGRNCSSYSQPKFSIELQSILYMLQCIIKCNVQLLVNKLACNYTVPKRFDWDGRQRNWL